ncbi:MAG: GYD domain-containing protein [Desulfobulbaceae bacterium]|nr:GYD domain-containing protein [Desulfobulbaceae bacterium]
MPKYLYHGSYTDKGLKGLMKDGGSKRMKVTKKAIESLGGRMEAYYFALGGSDFFIILEAPDNVRAITGSLVANASGTVKVNITALVSPEEVDLAVKQTMKWTPPGK